MDTLEAKKIIKEAKHIVFLGGAGVSTLSGIPDFRGPEGIYSVRNKYGVDYETLLSSDYFYDHTDNFYEFYWKDMVHEEAHPNAAHRLLARYEQEGHDITIITQNIDGLHQKAGSKKVIELHGSVHRYYCTRCAKRFKLEDIKVRDIPYCPSCGGLVKPDVTLYQEPLNQMALGAALEAIKKADVLIVAGTSMRVYPAAALPEYFMGKLSIFINLEKPPYNIFDLVYLDDIAKTLEELFYETPHH